MSESGREQSPSSQNAATSSSQSASPARQPSKQSSQSASPEPLDTQAANAKNKPPAPEPATGQASISLAFAKLTLMAKGQANKVRESNLGQKASAWRKEAETKIQSVSRPASVTSPKEKESKGAY